MATLKIQRQKIKALKTKVINIKDGRQVISIASNYHKIAYYPSLYPYATMPTYHIPPGQIDLS